MEADRKGFVTRTLAMFSQICRLYTHPHIYENRRGHLEGKGREETSRSAGQMRETNGATMDKVQLET